MPHWNNVFNINRSSPTRLVEKSLERAKISFNARRVDFSQAALLVNNVKPDVGDLVLARVKKISQHTNIHLRDGRRAKLYVGDTIVLAYANRYATDQFEALVPEDLSECNMAAAGGVASKVISRNSSMKAPTLIEPLGLIADITGKVMNTRDWALPKKQLPASRNATIIVVVGSEMNAGKTTTAASIIRGAVNADLRVAAAKITGTGAAGDFCEMRDAGAHYVYDLIDAGYPATYIDDPISSLDATACYYIYGLIKALENQVSQLFIMTHSHSFFVLLIKHFRNKKLYGHYEVQRFVPLGADVGRSQILEMEKKRLIYYSEYNYLFSLIYHASSEISAGETLPFDRLYTLMNCARKLIEGFLGFKYPDEGHLEQKWERAVADCSIDNALQQAVFKVVNFGSHSGVDGIFSGSGLEAPEMAQCVTLVLDFIQQVDPKHYEGMEGCEIADATTAPQTAAADAA